jgi:small subunit ribosomal protein S1
MVKKNQNNKQTKSKPPIASMEDLLASADYKIKGLKKGEFVKGIISEIKKTTLYIDIGAKTEGIIIGKELELVSDYVSKLNVGDEVSVQVRVPENEKGQILLSLRKAAFENAWGYFEEKLNSGEKVKVTGKEINRGGVVVNAPFGLFGFIPGSQIGSMYEHNPDNLVGKDIMVKVLEVDKEKNRLVFSERMVSEPEIVDREKEAIANIKIGDNFDAEVVRVEPFGLFVKIKGDKKKNLPNLEGLVHISEVSWDKVGNLSSLFRRGDKVKVVLVSKEDEKLQFSIKRLARDPWADIEKKYPKDSPIEGTVTQVTNFGALVKFEPGIEGLVHVSKIPPQVKIGEGEKISCFVERIDKENRRLSLELAMTQKPLIYK